MRKLIGILILFGICINSYAGESNQTYRDVKVTNYTTIPPVYQARTTDALTFYVTGGTLTSSVKVSIGTSSMTITSTSGGYAGSTVCIFSQTHINTVDKLASHLNATAATTIGIEDTAVAIRIQGSYGGIPSTQLAVLTEVTCFKSTNAVTLTLDNTSGVGYIIPAGTMGRRIHLSDVLVNATFVSGTTYVDIYDGTSTSDTHLRRETVPVSGKDAKLDISDTGDFYGSANTAMRIDLHNTSTWTTAGYINITAHKVIP